MKMSYETIVISIISSNSGVEIKHLVGSFVTTGSDSVIFWIKSGTIGILFRRFYFSDTVGMGYMTNIIKRLLKDKQVLSHT